MTSQPNKHLRPTRRR